MVVLCGVWCVFWLQKEFQPPPILTRPPLVVKADAADGQAFAVNEAFPFCLILAGFRTLPLAPLLLRDAGDPTHSLIQNKKAALSEYVQDGISQAPWRELERGTSVFRISISTSISATWRSRTRFPCGVSRAQSLPQTPGGVVISKGSRPVGYESRGPTQAPQ